MSHAGATLSHRRSEGPRRRSVVPVTLLIVLAVVAQACGSSDSSGSVPVPVGAQEDAVTSADWNFQLLTPDGMALPVWRADDGTQVNGYLIGEVNQLRAAVPAEVLASATEIVLEERTPTGVWNDTGLTLRVVDASGTPMQLPVDASGTAEGTFNGGGAFLGPHEFRLRAQARFAQNVVGYSNVVQATGFETEPVTVVETSGDWSFEMQNMDGSPLDQYTDSTGVSVNKLVVYEAYRFMASVPVELVTSNVGFVVEFQFPGGTWHPKYQVQVTADGVASWTFRPDMDAQSPRDYRLSAVTKEPGYTVVASSNVVRASADIEFSISIVNNTSNDLTVKIPDTYDESTQEWSYFEFGLAIGVKRTLKYVNPNSGVGFSMVLNKQKCFLDCTDYFMDWSWKPDTRPNSCTDLNSLALFSTSASTVTLSDNIDGQNSGWKTGIIEGPLLGPGTADTSCTFTTRTRDGQWLRNHPVKGALIFLAIVVLVVVAALVIVVAGAELLAGEGIVEITTSAWDEEAEVGRLVWREFARPVGESAVSFYSEAGEFLETIVLGT
jgi:hypothetical protein